MKFIIIAISLFLFSCNSSETSTSHDKLSQVDSGILTKDAIFANDKINEVDSGGISSPPSEMLQPTTETFSFAAFVYTITELTIDGDKTKAYSYVGGIVNTSSRLSRDNEYLLMDKVENQINDKFRSDFSVKKRKVFSFSSYADASEKRQEILNGGF